MPKIFVSYRRGDTAAHAGRLSDRLTREFGRESVFMDVTAIDPGVDFVEAIERAVGECDVLIVVIGRDWLEVKDQSGQRRIDDPKDFVRLEAKTALSRGIRVVPVLVERAELPASDRLPDDLKALVRRNALELRDTRWDADMSDLVRSLSAAFPRSRPLSRRSTQLSMLAIAGAFAVGAGIYGLRASAQPPPPTDASAAANPSTPEVVSAPTTAPSSPAPLLDSVCSEPRGPSLFDFKPGSTAWRPIRGTLSTNVVTAERDACGKAPGYLALELPEAKDNDGAGAALDLNEVTVNNWTGRKVLHVVVRADREPRLDGEPFDKLQIYVSSGADECVAEWTLRVPSLLDQHWHDLKLDLNRFDDGQAHAKSGKKCAPDLGRLNQIGITAFGTKSPTTLYVAELWLE